ncbi:insulinase family protein [Sphingomonas koreensis]|nr:insulinase family protein [Sphingomonas koreensis]
MIGTMLLRGATLLALLTAPGARLLAQNQSATATPPAAANAPIAQTTSWEHAGSDIPADPDWRTGTLPNGVRYAVRRNARPAGTIAIRLRMASGALMENEDQQGWSHLIEHMVFRGTQHYPDGDAVKIWQRLGASFGSDTNAATSATATTFMLDLPKNDAASYAQALSVMSDMVTSATIAPAPLDTERKVVIAERQQRVSPLARKVQDAGDAVLLAGLKAGKRDIGGTDATLAAASADALQAFYKKWYRPDRATIVVVGDADPAVLEAGVKQAFGDWKGAGSAPAEPDYGAIATPPKPAAVVTDPQAPGAIQLAWLRPHDESPFTVARQQAQFANFVATAIIGQRLATEAQQGKAIVNAAAGFPTARHVADQLTVSIVPRPGQWQAALDETFGVLNRLRATPPSQAEVDQQIASIEQGLKRSVEAQQTQVSPALANQYIGDVDQGDVTPKPDFYLTLFDASKPALTPAAIGKAINAQLAPDPRMLVLSPTAIDGGDAAAVTALEGARKVAGATNADLRKVSLDELKLPGAPGAVASSSTIADLGIERVRFRNGVELDFKKTAFEKDAIRLQVRIGHGVLNRAPNDPGLFWSSGALAAAGIGPFTPDELTRLTAGRQIGFGLQQSAEALVLGAQTNQADIGDAMKLMTGALTQMRYAETPLARLRDQFKATYQAYFSAPGTVLQAFGAPYFHGGDTRFRAMPPPAEVDALTLAAFRDFWQPQLAAGPIRIIAVGDLDRDKLIAAVAKTFGALPPRSDAKPTATQLAVDAAWHGDDPVILRHKGDADQAAVAQFYPTSGALTDLAASRALEIAGVIIQTRLTEGFREQQGGTYTPFAASSQSAELPDYGFVMAGAQLQLGRIHDFYAALDGIVDDLAKNGPDADELTRAVTTQVSALDRAQTDNGFWLGKLSGDLNDPRIVAAIRSQRSGLAAIDAKVVQAVAKKYLAGAADSFRIEALPEGVTPPK